MRIFEFPYIFIFTSIVLLLGGAVILFLVRGVKTENDEKESNFGRISRLESCFIKSGKLRENRGVLYISVALDHYRSLYSDERTEKVYAAIKQLLLRSFSPERNGMISTYGEYAYVAYSTLDSKEIKHMAVDFQAALTKCLIDNSALNVIEVRVGAFYALGSEISFDEAIHRAKQACLLQPERSFESALFHLETQRQNNFFQPLLSFCQFPQGAVFFVFQIRNLQARCRLLRP